MVETRKRLSDEEGDVGGKRFNAGKSTLKILVPNFMAGKLIGKGGSNIGELQSKFDLSIQVNPNKEFYPGTNDRIVCVNGDIEGISNFLTYLIDLVETELQSEKLNSTLTPNVRLVISDVAAGLIIGKGGEKIKSIISESNGAKINISKKAESVTGERVVIVSGSSEQRSTACNLLMETMATAPDKISNNNISYQSYQMPAAQSINSPHVLSGMGLMPISAGNGNAYSAYGNFDYKSKSQVEMKFRGQMEIPDKLVGTILGKGGQTIMDFSRSSGARLQFSKKEENADEEANRTLTITGSTTQVQNAYILVDEKLAQMEQRLLYSY